MSRINYQTILEIQIVRRKNPDMLRVWECSGQQKVKPQTYCVNLICTLHVFHFQQPSFGFYTWQQQVNNVLQQPCCSKGDSQGWDRGSAAHSHGQGGIKRPSLAKIPMFMRLLINVICNKWSCLWWILTFLLSTPGAKPCIFLLSRHVALGLWLQWSRMQEELKLLLVAER